MLQQDCHSRLAVSLHLWDTGLIPSLTCGVKNLVMLSLQRSSQLRLRSDPQPRNSIYCGAAKKEEKKEGVLRYDSLLKWLTEIIQQTS